jgi:hypothetical protein
VGGPNNNTADEAGNRRNQKEATLALPVFFLLDVCPLTPSASLLHLALHIISLEIHPTAQAYIQRIQTSLQNSW